MDRETIENMAKVLVVDDEGPNRYSVSKTLQRVGYTVSEAASGEDALDIMITQDFDVVLTDIRMEGIDGIELLRLIREQSPDAIVILMTGFASLGNAVEALRLGAHDYLIKPSSSVDIRNSVSRGVERARNLKRRRQLLEAIKQDVYALSETNINLEETSFDYDRERPRPQVSMSSSRSDYADRMSSNSTMQIGPLVVNAGAYRAFVDEKPVDLTPTEFDLLLYLAAHKGRVVPCAELVREVRGYDVDEAEAREVVRPHVSNLRRKLKDTGKDADLIVNVRGIGYRLSDKADVRN
ncbi:response regulator transcription factor [Anaerolineales bacterium]